MKYKTINIVIVTIAIVILVVALNKLNNENALINLQIQKTNLSINNLEKEIESKARTLTNTSFNQGESNCENDQSN
jgi:hypothetical protein